MGVEISATSTSATGVEEPLATAPSTEPQREIWAAVQMGDDASCAYNESRLLELRGRLDTAALISSLTDLVARHEALRTTFDSSGSTLRIMKPSPVYPPLLDLSGLEENLRRDRLSAVLRREVEVPFCLEKGPLFRTLLVRLSIDEHLLVLTVHHIVCDGFSSAVVMKDLAALYTAHTQGVSASLPATSSFSAYARELAQRQGTAKQTADERYWLDRFSASLPVLDLPLDRSRPPVKSYASGRHDHRVPSELIERVRKTSAQLKASLFDTLLAVFYVLLHRLSGQDDLAIGILSAGQPTTGRSQLVGHCVNTLPVRCQVNGNQPFAVLLERVRSAVLDAQDHQLYTLGNLLRALSIPRDPKRLPLVSVLFNLEQSDSVKALSFAGLQVALRSNPRRFENFDLSVNVAELSGELTFECQYNTDLFDEDTIERWFRSFERLLCEIVEQPSQLVDRLPVISIQEEHLRSTWNCVTRDYPRNRLVHQLVEEQVDRSPNAIAVVAGRAHLTYRELDQRANRLAHHLRRCGVGPETLVGLILERSLNMLVTILAVHKAGGAYVPLDPAFPAERLAFMVSDSDMPVLITQRSLRSGLPPHHARVVEIDGDDQEAIGRQSPERPPASAQPQNLAYVLYTSGSTGKPKGVQIPIRSMVNFLWSMRQEPGLSADDVLVAVTTLSFDIAVLELWLPLVVGARVVLANREVAVNGSELRSLLQSEKATVMQATPSTWRLLLAAGWSGGLDFKVICGGEAMPNDLATQLVANAGQVWNMYGPTETTVWSTCYRVPRSVGPILIGRPVANTSAYVLDQLRQPVPIGVTGELYLGGDGVARGYLNRPELTSQRFVEDPFSPPARLYRTGDLVRQRVDGNLEFLGRNDQQVKIRGFRIELGDIETALTRHPAVAQAVASVCTFRSGDVRLVGYLVLHPGAQLESSALREHLRKLLPEYMVPQHFVTLGDLPLTPNGKIDRKALPPIEAGAAVAAREYAAPRNDRERLLVAIWQEVLGVERVGIHDDFFALGGHSLIAVALIVQLKQRLGIDIPLSRILEQPTVEKLAASLEQTHSTTDKSRYLVSLSAQGSRPPMVVAPGAGGYGFFFVRLHSLLGDEQPLHLLRGVGTDQDTPLDYSVERMAEIYEPEVIAACPRGPIVLAGYSFGALVAFELAHRLRLRGRRVPLLVSFDGFAPAFPEQKPLRQRLVAHFKEFVACNGREKVDYFRNRVSHLAQRVMLNKIGRRGAPFVDSPFPDSALAKRMRRREASVMRARNRYHPQYVEPCSLLLIKAAVPFRWLPKWQSCPVYGWNKCLSGPISIVSVPGEHLALFQEENQPLIADSVARHISHIAESS